MTSLNCPVAPACCLPEQTGRHARPLSIQGAESRLLSPPKHKFKNKRYLPACSRQVSALVTLDAMGCQTKIAEAIRDKGTDYLLALKDNWLVLCAEVERFFADPKADTRTRHDTFDGGHGRVEIRRHAVCHEIDWLKSDRRFPGEGRFKDLAMIARVEARVERDGKTSIERRYLLSSAKLSAKRFAPTGTSKSACAESWMLFSMTI